MKTIAVTGGSGASGRVVCEHLIALGYSVVNLDRVFVRGHPASFREVDLERYGDVLSAMMGCDAVVHFAAHPEPDFDLHTGAQRFTNNTVSCFNVFNAAVALGLSRVVWASSETVHGFPYFTNTPAHFPVTEETPVQPQNAYAISKVLCEELAEHVCRLNAGISIVGLRLSNVLYEANHRDLYSKIPGYWDDFKSRKFNLWNYIDARDVARSVELSLVADLAGANVYNITAPDTIMRQDTRDLIAAEFPDVDVQSELAGRTSPVSADKARRDLGWVAQYTWQDVIDER